MAKASGPISPLPYPLTRKIRLTIMFTLISLFLIITPVLVFYARGFTFSVESGQLIHGGALSIESEPSQATLYLNDIKIKSQPPYRISHLLPGNYHVKIERQGFYAWERDITILSNQTTYLHDIDLFKIETPSSLISSTRTIEKLIAGSTSDSLIFSIQENESHEIFLFNRKNQRQTLLTRVISTSTPTLDWSPNGEFLKVESFTGGDKNLLLINPENPDSIQTLTFRSDIASSFQWQEEVFSGGLLVQHGKEIRRMDLNTTQPIFSLSTTSSLWFVDAENTLWELHDQEVKRYRGEKEIFSATITQSISKIVDANDKRIIGLKENKLVIIHFNNGTVSQEEEIPAKGYYFYRDQNYHLAWFDGELYSITRDGQVTLINRFSSDIQDIQPATTAGTLLILTQNKLITFHPKYFRTHELVSAEKIEGFGVNQKQKEIYFLGTLEGKRKVWRLGY